jgi:cytochrome c biogenesis protein ResB
VEFIDKQAEQVVGQAALALFADGEPIFQGPFYLEVDEIAIRYFTALTLHKDKSTPYMFSGLAVVMLGMMITFFVFHWQVWVRAESGRLLLGARAYKNKFGMRQEFRRLLGKGDGEGEEL